MVLSAALAVEHEADNDLRPEGADHADVVAEDLLLAPLLQRLLDGEREPEVHRAREVLFRAVVAMRRQQLLGAQHGERLEQFGANLVLPAFTARGGDQRGPHALAVPVVGQHRVVLVVGVRGGHHERAHRVELAEGELECGHAAQRRDWLQLMLRGRHATDGEDESNGEGEGG